jgi:hypothetical protein
MASLEDVKNDYVGKTIGKYEWWAAWPPIMSDVALGTIYGPVDGYTTGESQGNVGGTYGLKDLLNPAQVAGELSPISLEAYDSAAKYVGFNGSGNGIVVTEEAELEGYAKATIEYQATHGYAWRVVATELKRYAICPDGADAYDVAGTLQRYFWPKLESAKDPAWNQHNYVIVGQIITARQWVYGWSVENASTFSFNGSGSVLADLTGMEAGADITVTADSGASGGEAAENPDGSNEFVVGFSLYHFNGDNVTPYFP